MWPKFGERRGSSASRFCQNNIGFKLFNTPWLSFPSSSSSSSWPKSRGGKEEAVVDEGDEGDHTKDEQPEPQEHVDFLQKNTLDNEIDTEINPF